MLSKRDLILFVEELTIKLIVPDTSLTTVCNLDRNIERSSRTAELHQECV